MDLDSSARLTLTLMTDGEADDAFWGSGLISSCGSPWVERRDRKGDRETWKARTTDLLNICTKRTFEMVNLHIIRCDCKFKVP